MAQPETLVQRIAESFLADSPESEAAALFAARLATDSGRVEYAAAGRFAGWLIDQAGCRILPLGESAPGSECESVRRAAECQLAPGDAVVVIGPAAHGNGEPVLPANICEAIVDLRGQSAAALLDAVRAAVAAHAGLWAAQASLLVIKRRL
jgi:hypothetical protein